MIVYRLAKNKFASDLSGKGAEISGGRWNSKGVRMLYTCESRALCALEIAVRMPLSIIPEDYRIVEIELPETNKIFILDISVKLLTNNKIVSIYKNGFFKAVNDLKSGSA